MNPSQSIENYFPLGYGSRDPARLEFEVWDFFGVWILISPDLSIARRPAFT